MCSDKESTFPCLPELCDRRQPSETERLSISALLCPYQERFLEKPEIRLPLLSRPWKNRQNFSLPESCDPLGVGVRRGCFGRQLFLTSSAVAPTRICSEDADLLWFSDASPYPNGAQLFTGCSVPVFLCVCVVFCLLTFQIFHLLPFHCKVSG